MINRRFAIVSLSASGLLALAGCARQHPRHKLVRIVGYNDMKEMLAGLIRLAAAQDMPYSYEVDLPATKAAPPALLAGRSTLAPMGAEMTTEQQDAFLLPWGGRPIAFRIAHASLSGNALSSPIGILANSANPLSSITFAQARAIFAAEGESARTLGWDALGLDGERADRGIAIHGLDEETAIGRFMLGKLCGNRFSISMKRHFQSRDVAAALAQDIGAIGFGNLNHASGNVRALTIVDDHGVAHHPTGDAIAAGQYPFDRHLLIYARRDAEGRIEPAAARFLELVLSPTGQQSIAGGSLGYVPLNEGERVAELARLHEVSGRGGRPVALTASAPTILRSLAERWRELLASASSPIELHFDRTFGPPLGEHDEGLAGFLAGNRDLAFLTREIDEDDLAKFRRFHDHDPLIVPVAEGAWNKFGLVDAVAVIVNATNPLTSLNFQQISEIFFCPSSEPCRGVDWASLGVQIYGDAEVKPAGGKEWYPYESAKALTLRRQLQRSFWIGGQWRAPNHLDMRHVAQQVASDPLAIGFTAVGHLRPGVRMVPVAIAVGTEAVLPTEETIATGQYPLARTIDLVLARNADGSLNPPLLALAGMLLSAKGQDAIVKDGTFRPLARNRLAASLALLGMSVRQEGCAAAGPKPAD